MKILVRPRGAGKTFQMVLWFLEDTQHRAIIVPNMEQRTFLIKEIIKAFPETGKTTRAWVGHIWIPYTVTMRRRGRTIKEVWIDNVDMVLRELAGYGIPLTMSSSEEVELI